jgi:hypothetical protein
MQVEPIQLSSICFTVCTTFLPSWLHGILIHSSHDRSKWSASFSRTTLQNIQGISHRHSEVSNLQHHAKLCSKCRILPKPFSNFSPMCLWKIILVHVEWCFCHAKSELYFTCIYLTVLFSCHKSNWNILQPSVAFDLSQSALWMVALRFSLP